MLSLSVFTSTHIFTFSYNSECKAQALARVDGFLSPLINGFIFVFIAFSFHCPSDFQKLQAIVISAGRQGRQCNVLTAAKRQQIHAAIGSIASKTADPLYACMRVSAFPA